MDQIGLEAVFRDAEFQQGLARYTAGVARMQDQTTRSAMSMGSSMTAFSHTFSTAVGTVIGIITAQLIPQLQRAMMSPIDSLRGWGEQLDLLRDEFGMSGAEASQWAVSMGTYMGSVEEGASGLSVFVRNLNNMQDGLQQAGSQYGTTMRDISSAHVDAMAKIAQDWATSQADAADNITSVWADLAERRAEIEANLRDQITSIQESLNERLEDFARQRADIEKDTTKSLARLEDDTRDRLRNARSAKERRQIRKDAAQRRADLLEQAAERKAEIDRQEAQARKQAEKQMELAEKVAQKQIEAAEKAANKQVAAIEKTLAKQLEAMRQATEAENKQYAKQQQAAVGAMGKSGGNDPIAKALKQLGVNAFTASGKVRPFAELMPEIMDAFKKLPPGINASAIAMQLFGRSGSKFLDFLRQGREGLVKAREEARAWGLILTNEDTDAIEELGFELNRLKLQFLGIAVTIGREVLPYVSQFVGWLRQAVTDAMPAFQSIVSRLSSAFKSGGLEGLGKEFWQILTEPKGVFEQLGIVMGKIRDWFTNGEGKKILEAIGVGFSIIVAAFTAWVNSAEGRKAIRDLTKALADAIFSGIKLLFGDEDEVKPIMNRLVDTLRNVADGLWSALMTVGSEIGGDIISGVVGLFAGEKAANDIRKGIETVFNNGLNAIIKSGVGNLFGKSLAEIAMYGFIETWKKMFAGWNPFGGGSAPKPPTYSPKEYDLGGWVNRTGPALVHAGEYVLNPMQARLMAPVLTSPNYSRTTYNFSHTWNGGGGMNRTEIERIVENATYRGIRQVMGAG